MERPARAGKRLVREGERPHPYGEALCPVLEGEVEIRRQDRDQAGAGPIARLGPGEFFGVVSLVDDGPRAASCVVARPGRLACPARRTLEALSTSAPVRAPAVGRARVRQMAHDHAVNERRVARLSRAAGLAAARRCDRPIRMSPRRLILMRHAKAEPASPAVPDHARALTERGQGDAPRMASWLVAQGWSPQAVVCSDSTRTWQTWERMAGALATPPELRVSRSLYLGGLSELIAHARGWPEAWTTVLAIGHNPGWEEAVTSLSGQLLAMKPAGCALLLGEGVDWSESLLGDWRLVGSMRPRELE